MVSLSTQLKEIGDLHSRLITTGGSCTCHHSRWFLTFNFTHLDFAAKKKFLPTEAGMVGTFQCNQLFPAGM